MLSRNTLIRCISVSNAGIRQAPEELVVAMRRNEIVAGFAVVLLAGCGSTSSGGGKASGAADAAHLASLTASGSVNQINAALSLLVPRCTESRTKVAHIVYATWKDLHTHGFHDSAATVALAIAHSVPNSMVPAACDQIAHAYLAKREE